MESTNIRVKLNSVEQVRQFVETMRKYDGGVDVRCDRHSKQRTVAERSTRHNVEIIKYRTFTHHLLDSPG